MEKIFSSRLVDYLIATRKAQIGDKFAEFCIEFNDIYLLADGNLKVEIADDVPGNFYDLRDGEISYHPIPERQQISPQGKWIREGRMTLKAGKFLNFIQKNAYINLNCFEDSNWKPFDISNIDEKKFFVKYTENFAAAVKGTKVTIDLKISDDPSTIYQLPTYYDSKVGSLGSSCMRPESVHYCKNGFDFYSKCGGKILYCIAEENNRKFLVARAHLWENTICEDGTVVTFLDRIYANEVNTNQIIDYAYENGWWTKVSQDSHSRQITNGNIIKTVSHRKINTWEMRGVQPYMDTFLSVNENTLFAETGKGLFDLQSTSAVFRIKKVCPCCGDTFYEENGVVYEGELYCSECVVNDDWNGGQTLIRNTVNYYDTDGNRCRVHRSNTEGLIIVNIQGVHRIAVPIQMEEVSNWF